MFRAVRKWWKSVRGKDTFRLFAFELTVVIIGVLIAQQVSNWATNRFQMREVEGLRRNLNHLSFQYRLIARSYDAALPCLNDRVDLILKHAAGQSPIEPQLLKYAPLTLMGPDHLSADDFRLLRERYGNPEVDLIASVQFVLQATETDGRALETHWFEFQRLNPQFGPVSSEDRAAARAAAVKIKGYLLTLQNNADKIQSLTDRMKIRDNPEPNLRPVASCAEMWRMGQGYVAKPGVNTQSGLRSVQ